MGSHAAYRDSKIFFSFFGRRVVSLWTILLNFRNTQKLLHTEKCFRFRVGKIVPRCGDTYDFTNDLTGMYCLSPSNNTEKTFRYARWCSLVLLDEKRRHLRRISLDLSSLFISAFSPPFHECSEIAASLPCIVKRNTYFVLAHPFAFDDT